MAGKGPGQPPPLQACLAPPSYAVGNKVTSQKPLPKEQGWKRTGPARVMAGELAEEHPALTVQHHRQPRCGAFRALVTAPIIPRAETSPCPHLLT
jgi:hypothetical protein